MKGWRQLVESKEISALWRLSLFTLVAAGTAFVLGKVARLAPVGGLRGMWAHAASSTILVVALLLASYAMMRWIDRRPRPLATLGLPAGPTTAADLVRGAAIGGAFIAAVVGAQLLLGWLRLVPGSGSLLSWLEHIAGLAMLLAIAATVEELLFRGYAFQVLAQGFGVTLAVVVGAGLFAALHAGNPEVGPVALMNIALAGVLLAAAYVRTRSLWVAIGLHWAWNWLMAAVFDLPVSGLVFDTPGYDLRELGPDLATGGAFGPEGGLLMTLLMVPLIVWIFSTPWLRASPEITNLRPLIDTA